jgi:hypothetical protein
MVSTVRPRKIRKKKRLPKINRFLAPLLVIYTSFSFIEIAGERKTLYGTALSKHSSTSFAVNDVDPALA